MASDNRERGTVSYDADTNLSTLMLPYVLPENFVLQRADTYQILPWLPTFDPYIITTKGDITNVPVFGGVLYEMRYRFSPAMILVKSQDGGMSALGGGRLQVQSWTVNFVASGTFDMEVFVKNKTTKSKRFGTRVVGSGLQEFGKARTFVLSRAELARVDIVSTHTNPIWFTSAEWSGEYTRQDQLV